MTWKSRKRALTSVPPTAEGPIVTNATHLNDDALERYAMGVIRDESELARLEEHLLACPGCVARTETWENYLWSLRPSLRQVSIHLIKASR